ncbi:hypothetical protein JOF56_009569 [Kibdelosporangium banguiense]|uniref:TIGR03086 family protein n=1 Tax=Kibdelosporangium banguiense TaxID=1365924 RepID=A0ABS4TYZ8_9PSEU|nr:hypothetical protein [Kibdelosporangium banguiense]MBP2329184.1 hypothetical protein [Kibdelosporangium banguiense]
MLGLLVPGAATWLGGASARRPEQSRRSATRPCWSNGSTSPTGRQLATISMLEILVHGWDIASGAGVPYKPDDAVVTAVREYAMTAISEAPRGGPFGPVVLVAVEADPFTALLGHLSRRG